MKHSLIIILSLLLTCPYVVHAQVSAKSKQPVSVDFSVPEQKPVNSMVPEIKQDVINEDIKTLAAKSDVDVNIPVANEKKEKTFAVIIANENYRRESQVEFALNDGKMFQQYCIQTLGLLESNVHLSLNATLNEMIYEIEWISNVAKAYKGEANIIFYYAGHGVPDESTGTAYLLPTDGISSSVRSGYKLNDLYSELGKLPAHNITVFIDACFSGVQRSDEEKMLALARGVRIEAVKGVPIGNMVVLSAAQGKETAYPYREKEHGMFTYFLLKKLQETKGNATLGEISNYVITNVEQKSIVVNGRSQTPMVIPSMILKDIWQDIKLK